MPWRRRFALGVALALLWLTFSAQPSGLLLGLGGVSVLLALVLARRLLVVREQEPIGLLRGRRVPGYCGWLAWETCKSNLRVAGLLLRPRPRIRPCVVRLEHGLRTDLGRALYASSITLTPGTLTLHVDEHTVEVHALTAEAASDLAAGAMERRVKFLEVAQDPAQENPAQEQENPAGEDPSREDPSRESVRERG